MNKYEELWSEAMEDDYPFFKRKDLVKQFAWAVPNEQAVRTIASFKGDIVEMGAGTGYWSHLIRIARGSDLKRKVLAFDEKVGNTYGEVRKGRPETLKQFGVGWALLLCWPPYNDSMAADCLEHFQGNTLFYVGESEGGCTGDDAFFEKLKEGWHLKEVIDIPQWEGINDYLAVYVRRST